ncbi:hypothetical protein WN51_06075 [Melipona quadrifasciata]|uniref:Uncharacterized protein n=1 Tax=Melipona quadrifasciata TaxID=166423 RepID=A0A0N0BBX3_9HYME|nr:hypothetical protein WN51_06075 [Melipona quadrifasciata]
MLKSQKLHETARAARHDLKSNSIRSLIEFFFSIFEIVILTFVQFCHFLIVQCPPLLFNFSKAQYLSIVMFIAVSHDRFNSVSKLLHSPEEENANNHGKLDTKRNVVTSVQQLPEVPNDFIILELSKLLRVSIILQLLKVKPRKYWQSLELLEISSSLDNLASSEGLGYFDRIFIESAGTFESNCIMPPIFVTKLFIKRTIAGGLTMPNDKMKRNPSINTCTLSEKKDTITITVFSQCAYIEGIINFDSEMLQIFRLTFTRTINLQLTIEERRIESKEQRRRIYGCCSTDVQVESASFTEHVAFFAKCSDQPEDLRAIRGKIQRRVEQKRTIFTHLNVFFHELRDGIKRDVFPASKVPVTLKKTLEDDIFKKIVFPIRLFDQFKSKGNPSEGEEIPPTHSNPMDSGHLASSLMNTVHPKFKKKATNYLVAAWSLVTVRKLVVSAKSQVPKLCFQERSLTVENDRDRGLRTKMRIEFWQFLNYSELKFIIDVAKRKRAKMDNRKGCEAKCLGSNVAISGARRVKFWIGTRGYMLPATAEIKNETFSLTTRLEDYEKSMQQIFISPGRILSRLNTITESDFSGDNPESRASSAATLMQRKLAIEEEAVSIERLNPSTCDKKKTNSETEDNQRSTQNSELIQTGEGREVAQLLTTVVKSCCTSIKMNGYCYSFSLSLCNTGPVIPRLRVSNTRLAQAASGCAPSVEVLPISDVKQSRVRQHR